MLGHYVWEFIDNSERSKEGALRKLAGITPEGRNIERDFCKKDGTKIPALIEDKFRYDRASCKTPARQVPNSGPGLAEAIF